MNLDTLMVASASNIVLAAALGVVAWAIARGSCRPALAHALYLLALIKLVTPPLLDLPILPDLYPVVGAAVVPMIPGSGPFAAMALDTGLQTSTSVGIGFSWQECVVLVWLVGSLMALCTSGYRMWRLDRWITGMLPASCVVQGEVAHLADRLGLRWAPRACVVDAFVSPMLCPTRRGLSMVLPSRLLATLSTAEREAMLTHELAHVLRRDHWVRWLEIVVLSAWWWLPLAYLLRRGLRRVEELCCDSTVLAILPGREVPYSSVLVATARLLARRAYPLPPHVCGLDAVGQLEERIQIVHTQGVQHGTGPRDRLFLAMAALAILPFAACVDPHAGVSSSEASKVTHVSPTRSWASLSGETGSIAHLTGEVVGPSVIDVVPGTNALDALVSVQLTDAADLRHAVLIRVGGAEPATLQLDFRKMILTGDKSLNVQLHAGDIIYFPTKRK